MSLCLVNIAINALSILLKNRKVTRGDLKLRECLP